ncbi:MAG: NADH dehydrogenase [Oceanicoccus sp.]|jgi:NADH dehydrogenase
MPKRKKIILVLGAGIAGLRVVQRLQKRLPNTHEIILVDKSPVHVFSSDLYQVATVFSKKITETCLARIKETVATPISRLVDPWKVTYIQSEVTGIDPKAKKVFLKSGSPLKFDLLVVALGSVTKFFDVPGVKEYAYPLKIVTDALAVNCQIDHLFLQRYKSKSKEAIVITIAGGGATGVEVAGELMGTLDKLCKKYKHDPKKVTVQLIQSGETLAAFDAKGTKLIKDELEKMGVQVYLEHRVTALKKTKVELLRKFDGESISLPCHMLIWTCGVQVNPVVAKSLGDPKLRGAIAVRSTLETKKHTHIFALGDCARVRRSPHSKDYVPMMAQYAMQEADIMAANILRRIQQRPLKQFHMGVPLYVVPVGFNFTLFKVKDWTFKGMWTQWLKPIITLKYALAILPLRRAWQKFRLGEAIWEQNDL